MSHIAMFNIGAHGHVNPNLPVIAELVARGHRVSYAVPESFAPVVASSGATPVVYDSVLPDEAAGERWPDGGVEAMSIFLDEAEQALPQLRAAFAGDRPDVVLHDIAAYAARVLAHQWSVPIVQLSPAMVAWDGYADDMAEVLAPIRDDPAWPAYQTRFAAWLAEHGIALSVDEFTGRPPRCIVLIPRALQPHADRVDAAVYTFVGPSLDARPHQGDWPAPDRPLLLISLGSAYTDHPAFYRDCLTAFGGLDWQVVISIGRHVDPTELGELPPNVELHRWVPQLAVLGRASAFITHAGMGGCSEGLYQGVPMVAVPQAVDQFTNAAMLEELGVGVHVPMDQATPQALRTAVLDLVGSPVVAARAAALRAELRAAGGAARAADIIEAQLRR
ncbi:macrolide family glycosyltransferase [Pseudonocardia bannensis]|uniref:Glycosyl transferase n=1 Tax=Pseudonocardia bannensis TaxID=630973 RepID=A0A848DNQ1_9PSEU|nr:macrolide family glycosyltransferase [Pseudonocardia bannensis]NMH94051.1 glycosyl transferase [Pseudonocardia bannensis]